MIKKIFDLSQKYLFFPKLIISTGKLHCIKFKYFKITNYLTAGIINTNIHCRFI